VASWCLCIGLISISACSLLVDTDAVDSGCTAEQKWCEGSCVARDNAAYGCSSDLCSPCSLANAIPRCKSGECVVAACLFGFGCPSDDGCQVNVTIDRNHCGRCGNVCHAPCRNAECVITECEPGYADCDPQRDGCETSLAEGASCQTAG
jgi:hypothetical protein